MGDLSEAIIFISDDDDDEDEASAGVAEGNPAPSGVSPASESPQRPGERLPGKPGARVEYPQTSALKAAYEEAEEAASRALGVWKEAERSRPLQDPTRAKSKPSSSAGIGAFEGPLLRGARARSSDWDAAEAAEVYSVAAMNIAQLVSDHESRFGMRPSEDKGQGLSGEFSVQVPAELGHEQELEMLIRPQLLRTGPWEDQLPEYRRVVAIGDGAVPDMLRQMSQNLNAINAKLDRALCILNLHSASLVAQVKVSNEMRLLFLGKEKEKDAAYRHLQASLRAIVLGSDPDLRGVPFTSLHALETFFRRQSRVEKLCYLLLAYYDYGEGYYAAILNATLGAALQRRVLWTPAGTGA